METVKDMMIFCNASLLFDYEKEGIIEEFNLLRNCIIKIFRTKNLTQRVFMSLGIIDEIILKIEDHNVDNIDRYINDLRENIMYMRLFLKLQNTVDKYSNDENDDNQQ